METERYILVKRAISSEEIDGFVFFSTRRRCSSRISRYHSGKRRNKGFQNSGIGAKHKERKYIPLDDPRLPRSNLFPNGDAVKPRSGATEEKKKTPERARVEFKVFLFNRKKREEKDLIFGVILTRRSAAICSARDLAVFRAGPPNDVYSIVGASSAPSLLLSLPPSLAEAGSSSRPMLSCTISRCALYSSAWRSAPEKPSVASAR